MLCIHWGEGPNHLLGIIPWGSGWLHSFLVQALGSSCRLGGYTKPRPPEGTMEALPGSLFCTQELISFQCQWSQM